MVEAQIMPGAIPGPHDAQPPPLPPFQRFSPSAPTPAGPVPSDDWRPILDRIGVGPDVARAIAAQARTNGVSFQRELLAAGLADEGTLFQALAAQLGLEFLPDPDPETLVMSDDACLRALRLADGVPMAHALTRGGETRLLLAPARIAPRALRDLVARRPAVAARLAIVTPTALRAAIAARAEAALVRIARDGLFETMPGASARVVATAWQGALLGAFLVAFPVCLSVAQSLTQIVAHVTSSLFFLACIGLRVAVSGSGPSPLRPPRLTMPDPASMPVYTVIVALYREAPMIPDLLVALGKIVWPRSKLEIKLVCEADDDETLDALAAQTLRPCVEVISVPPRGPRTKPKALSYALPQSGGEFVVLYDAEDKPHPLQLLEAWQRFEASGPDLACLQAPLSISNRRQGLLPALFGLEYAALFRGILPWLARRGELLPLGGTSNHFRRDALEEVGAWDPYNVTEDADLGVRLKRFGYRIGTLAYPTREDAPRHAGVWLAQRTRWFKGWAQTWLVHMREPLRLMRELGPVSFLVAQILFAGMLVSALVHPIFLATIAWYGMKAIFGAGIDMRGQGMLVLDGVNIAGGYVAFLMLGWQTLADDERPGFARLVAATPLYWMLMSVAAWRALWQLYRRPHYWAKTPHEPRRGVKPNAAHP